MPLALELPCKWLLSSSLPLTEVCLDLAVDMSASGLGLKDRGSVIQSQ